LPPRVSCSEYSFPAVADQDARIGVVKLLGFEAVDIALFLHDGAELARNPHAVAQTLSVSLATHQLISDDLFLVVGETPEEAAPNQRDDHLREQARGAFLAAAQVASEVGIPAVTILPGVNWPDDEKGSWHACVEELAWRVTEARMLGVEVRIEPHAGSIVASPELTARICTEVPGLRVTLDPAHFELQSISTDRMLTLVPFTAHVHVRAAEPGAIQVHWRDNQVNYTALIESLEAFGYTGVYAIEYVSMEKWRCDELDVVTETLTTRDQLRRWGLV
jgi:sugar phosphate isomerase/epimerase